MLSRIVVVLGIVGIAGCWEDEPPIDECVCTAHYAPVCGVDGVTYGNACEAGCAGAEIAHEGECVETACTSDAECGMGQYCDLACWALEGDRAAPYGYDGGSPDGGVPYPCEGVCRDLTPPPTECYSDYDCSMGEQCVFDGPCYFDAPAGGEGGAADRIAPRCTGQCQPAPDPVCTSDADCAPTDYCDLSCDGGGPRPLPGAESPDNAGGFAYPEPDPYPHGGVCRPRPGLCDVTLCEAGTHCTETCEDVVCITWPCPPVCRAECVPDVVDPYCEDDSWCAPDQTCGNLICEELCFIPKDGPGGCGPWCHGQCIPRIDPPPYCTSDDECGRGQHCLMECPPPPECPPGETCVMPFIFCPGQCVPVGEI